MGTELLEKEELPEKELMQNAEQETIPKGKKRSKKEIIGIDPLQWLKNESLEMSSAEDSNVSKQDTSDELTLESDKCIPSEQEYDTMEIEVKIMSNENNHEMKIEGPVTIADVGELHEKFKGLISNKEEIVINCAAIEGIDAAALQLFVAMGHEADNNKLSITWKEPSESFKEAACMMGLSSELRLSS